MAKSGKDQVNRARRVSKTQHETVANITVEKKWFLSDQISRNNVTLTLTLEWLCRYTSSFREGG
jgi:hypothetical protein